MDVKVILAETREKLKALPSRPAPDAVERARRSIAAIDKKLASKLEVFMAAAVPAGANPVQVQELQERKKAAAVHEAEADKGKHIAVIDLETQYRHFEDVIRRGELASIGGDDTNEAELLIKEEIARKLADDIQVVIKNEVKEVDWSCRELEFLPETFGKMVSVTSLDVSRNFLEVLPDAIAGVVHLQVLDLTSNRLRRLPDSIGALSQLRRLIVARNKLFELPQSICNCRLLEELDLTFNDLETLPDQLGEYLSNLRRLAVGLNKIKYLPSTITKLTELTHLDVHFNQLQALPSTIDNLYKLQVLNVSDNFSDLTSIPASLGNISTLVELNLSNNQIHHLPIEIGRLTGLKKLELQGNPWKNPPLEFLVGKDHDSLMQFLQQLYKTGPNQKEDSPLVSFANWLNSVFYGRFDFGAWLNSIVSGVQFPQLLGLPPPSRRSSVTELRSLENVKDHDLEGGSGSTPT